MSLNREQDRGEGATIYVMVAFFVFTSYPTFYFKWRQKQ